LVLKNKYGIYWFFTVIFFMVLSNSGFAMNNVESKVVTLFGVNFTIKSTAVSKDIALLQLQSVEDALVLLRGNEKISNMIVAAVRHQQSASGNDLVDIIHIDDSYFRVEYKTETRGRLGYLRLSDTPDENINQTVHWTIFGKLQNDANYVYDPLMGEDLDELARVLGHEFGHLYRLSKGITPIIEGNVTINGVTRKVGTLIEELENIGLLPTIESFQGVTENQINVYLSLPERGGYRINRDVTRLEILQAIASQQPKAFSKMYAAVLLDEGLYTEEMMNDFSSAAVCVSSCCAIL
jgi:hypothetical protein